MRTLSALCNLFAVVIETVAQSFKPGAPFTEDLRIILRQFSHIGHLKTMSDLIHTTLTTFLSEFKTELVLNDRNICHS